MKKSVTLLPTRKELLINISVIVFLLIIKASVFANYTVPTGSMKPTIIEGDMVFSANIAYSMRVPLTRYHLLRWGTPERGDVVCFIYPGDGKTRYVKRVIGVAGDEIEISDGNVAVNGAAVRTRPVRENGESIICEETIGGIRHFIRRMKHRLAFDAPRTFKVPAGQLFVMGDNRDDSYDSRYWGFLPVDNVLGKLTFRYFSIDPESRHIKPDRIGPIH